MNRKITTTIAAFALFGLSGCNLIKTVNQVIPAEGPPVSVDYSDHAVEGVTRPGLVAPAAPVCEGSNCPTPAPVFYPCPSTEGAIVEGANQTPFVCP